MIRNLSRLIFNKSKFNDHGFTLIELLVAIILMGILGGIVFTSASGVLRQARNGQRRSDMARIQSALQQYYSDHGYYPFDNGNNGLNLGYIGGPPSIDECLGVSPGYVCPANKRIYLSNTPKEPNQKDDPNDNYGVHYCYQSFHQKPAAASYNVSSPACSNSSDATSCQFYFVYSIYEGPPTGTSNLYQCNGNGGHGFPADSAYFSSRGYTYSRLSPL